MARKEMKDIIVVLPGILGSVLQRDGKDVWAVNKGAAWQALKSLGGSIKSLELSGDDPNLDSLDDGVVATRLMPDVHLIPSLWKIDGYGEIAKAVKATYEVTEGENYFEFPYDWRRDNRVHGRRLRRESHDWLKAWRANSGNDDARLILLAHSMGGLVSRAFLELEDGWKDTRRLITFGTPYRGSLNALGFIANGFKKGIGPFGLDLSDMLRSLTSVYQLLPIYPCYESGDGLVRTTEASDIPNLDQAKANAAMKFHHEIMNAVETNAETSDYQDSGYDIHPIVGIGQKTLQSARRSGDRVSLLTTYEGEDLSGDGTVPRVSAMPVEMKDAADAAFNPAKHSSLQNTKGALTQVRGLLTAGKIDSDRFRDLAMTSLSLDVDDLYGSEEPIEVRAQASAHGVNMTASFVNVDSGDTAATIDLGTEDGDWMIGAADPLPEGVYRVTLTSDAEAQPVEDLVTVV